MDGQVEKAAEQLEFFHASLGSSAVCLCHLNTEPFPLLPSLNAILKFIRPCYDLQSYYLVSPRL